jgi:hypothetical protein
LGLGIKTEGEIDLVGKDLSPDIPGFKAVLRTIGKEVLNEETT